MLTVKCPHCATALKLQQAPPAGKVKCPKCGKVVPVGAPSAASPKPVSTGRALDPDDEGFDFGRISFPSAAGAAAVTEFPMSGRLSIYDGPIPGDPLDGAEEAAGEQDAPPPTPGKGKKKSWWRRG